MSNCEECNQPLSECVCEEEICIDCGELEEECICYSDHQEAEQCPYCSAEEGCEHFRGVYDATYGGTQDALSKVYNTVRRQVVISHIYRVFLRSKKIDSIPDELKFDSSKRFVQPIEEIESQILKLAQGLEVAESTGFEDYSGFDWIADEILMSFDLDIEEMLRGWLEKSGIISAQTVLDRDGCVEYVVYSQSNDEKFSMGNAAVVNTLPESLEASCSNIAELGSTAVTA